MTPEWVFLIARALLIVAMSYLWYQVGRRDGARKLAHQIKEILQKENNEQ